jgi:hypothetical protein
MSNLPLNRFKTVSEDRVMTALSVKQWLVGFWQGIHSAGKPVARKTGLFNLLDMRGTLSDNHQK